MKITTKSQIETRLPEQKPNRITNAYRYSVRPNIAKPHVGSSFVCRVCQSLENIFDVPFLFERPNLKYFWSNLKGRNFSILVA